MQLGILDIGTGFDIIVFMQITREADYGIRSILYLARQPYKKVSFISEISQAYQIPQTFLAKILQKLVKAKIVRSYRGVKGGFTLAKQAREINALEVLEAIEGKLALNICIADKKNCVFSKNCPSHVLWMSVQAKMVDTLKKANFEDLVKHKT